jgi:Tol biopolymer transport system component
VEVKQNTKPRKVAMGADPSFSPDGKYLAFTYIPGGDVLVSDHAYKVCILNLSTNQIRTLRENAREPFWSSDGREIALIDTSPQDFNASTLIVDAQTGKIRFQTDKMVNPTTPLLSPNGRYLAVHPHMSRPLTGHIIIDRQTGKLLDYDFYPKGYAPGPLNAWSSDGKWLLWTVRIPDPKNDGSWLQEEIWLISIDAKVKRKISVGTIGDFSPDGKHVLWLRPSHKTKRRQSTYDLMWSPLQGLKKVRLVSQVNAFAIFKPPK